MGARGHAIRSHLRVSLGRIGNLPEQPVVRRQPRTEHVRGGEPHGRAEVACRTDEGRNQRSSEVIRAEVACHTDAPRREGCGREGCGREGCGRRSHRSVRCGHLTACRARARREHLLRRPRRCTAGARRQTQRANGPLRTPVARQRKRAGGARGESGRASGRVAGTRGEAPCRGWPDRIGTRAARPRAGKGGCARVRSRRWRRRWSPLW